MTLRVFVAPKSAHGADSWRSKIHVRRRRSGVELRHSCLETCRLGWIYGNEYDMYLRKAREELKKCKTNLNRKSYDVMKFRNNNHLKFPLQAPIARKWLCALATSVPSERCFSTTGNVVTKKRAALGSDRIRDIIFMHDNVDKLH